MFGAMYGAMYGAMVFGSYGILKLIHAPEFCDKPKARNWRFRISRKDAAAATPRVASRLRGSTGVKKDLGRIC
jgi:hypothetical protein